MKNIISNERKELFLLARNEINTISFKNLKTREIDLFYFYLIALKENKLQPVTIKFSEIKSMLDIKWRYTKIIYDLIEKSNDKLHTLNFKIITKNKKNQQKTEFKHIFEEIKIMEETKIVTISLHKHFIPILNDLNTGNFTKIDFFELRNLKLMYSKKLYPILKQQSSGKVYLKDIEKFKEQLSINKSYQFKDIKKQILIPTIKELSKIFPNLKLETKKIGNKVTQIGFSFTPVKNKKIVTKKINENKKENNFKTNSISIKKDNHKLVTEKTNFNDYHKENKWLSNHKRLSKKEIKKILNDFDNS